MLFVLGICFTGLTNTLCDRDVLLWAATMELHHLRWETVKTVGEHQASLDPKLTLAENERPISSADSQVMLFLS